MRKHKQTLGHFGMGMTTLYTLISRSHLIHNRMVFKTNLHISERLILSKQKQYRLQTSYKPPCLTEQYWR